MKTLATVAGKRDVVLLDSETMKIAETEHHCYVKTYSTYITDESETQI